MPAMFPFPEVFDPACGGLACGIQARKRGVPGDAYLRAALEVTK